MRSTCRSNWRPLRIYELQLPSARQKNSSGTRRLASTAHVIHPTGRIAVAAAVAAATAAAVAAATAVVAKSRHEATAAARVMKRKTRATKNSESRARLAFALLPARHSPFGVIRARVDGLATHGGVKSASPATVGAQLLGSEAATLRLARPNRDLCGCMQAAASASARR